MIERLGFGAEDAVLTMNITFDRYSLKIDGERTFIQSGAMHYFRLPSQELWLDRLFKLKAAGYNCVDLYFCWNYHSPAQGVYDFTGIRDIARLLEITRELGLYVIARPGPYINAEYSGGGFPGWLLAKKDMPLRNRREGAFEWSEDYMDAVREWWAQIIPFINASDNVLMVQIENEYATLEVEPEYMQEMYKMTRDLGVTVPLFHNDLYVAGLYEDIVDIYSFDNYSVTQFETDWRTMPEIFQVLDNVENHLRTFCQNRPLMAAELQAGWYGTWKGYKYEKITDLLGREHIGISTKSLLGQGLTIFNHYKAIGGTNWDYTGSIETYTSYDFGAPIAESGLNTERLYEAKALNWLLQSFDLTATDRVDDCPVQFSTDEFLYAVRKLVKTPEMPASDVDPSWIFLRNLTETTRTLTVTSKREPAAEPTEKSHRFAVSLRPFEVLMLPYHLPLKSGATLVFSTSEPLYQTESLLVIKADRPVSLCMTAPNASPDSDFVLPADSHDLDCGHTAASQPTLYCPELSPKEYREAHFGDLRILLLGAHSIDMFWVEDNGTIVIGPDVRVPASAAKGNYGLAPGNHQALTLSAHTTPSGAEVPFVSTLAAPAEHRLQIPVLRDWLVENDAPELHDSHWFDNAFKRVSPLAADFDENGVYEGNGWYRLTLPIGSPTPKTIALDARHIWSVFINGEYIQHGQHLVLIHGLDEVKPNPLTVSPSVWKTDAPNEMLIFVSGLGHPKGFHDDAQTPQGLLLLEIDGVNRLADVDILAQVYSQRPTANAVRPADFKSTVFDASPLVHTQTTFSLPDDSEQITAWGIKLQDVDFERIDLILNGALIGRYWRECRRQEIFYMPSGLLKLGSEQSNTLELVLMNFKPFVERDHVAMQPHQVALHAYGTFNRLTEIVSKP